MLILTSTQSLFSIHPHKTCRGSNSNPGRARFCHLEILVIKSFELSSQRPMLSINLNDHRTYSYEAITRYNAWERRAGLQQKCTMSIAKSVSAPKAASIGGSTALPWQLGLPSFRVWKIPVAAHPLSRGAGMTTSKKDLHCGWYGLDSGLIERAHVHISVQPFEFIPNRQQEQLRNELDPFRS